MKKVLSDQDVETIFKMYKEGKKISDIAKLFLAKVNGSSSVYMREKGKQCKIG